MIRIVFENQHFIICDKESGVLSTPSRFEANDQRRCLGTELQDQLRCQIFPVHRLDFEVSGLVIYAKNPASHAQANAWFEHKTVKKTYRALTQSQSFVHIPPQIQNPRQPLALQVGAEFNWRTTVMKGKRRSFESPQGKPSLTEAKYLGLTEAGFLAWDLSPITGRSHQLRFDLSRHGFPILGDKLYGANVEWRENSIALRSYRLDFSLAPGALALGLDKHISVDSL